MLDEDLDKPALFAETTGGEAALDKRRSEDVARGTSLRPERLIVLGIPTYTESLPTLPKKLLPPPTCARVDSEYWRTSRCVAGLSVDSEK